MKLKSSLPPFFQVQAQILRQGPARGTLLSAKVLSKDDAYGLLTLRRRVTWSLSNDRRRAVRRAGSRAEGKAVGVLGDLAVIRGSGREAPQSSMLSLWAEENVLKK